MLLSRNNRSVGRFILASVLVATLTSAGLVPAAPARADCRESSWIPQTSHFQFRSADGRNTMHVQLGIENRRDFLRVWMDSRLTGAYFLPVTVIPGQITALHRTKTVYETWMGKVQLVTKNVPVVQVCGSGWVPVVFS
ncbi:hypothetical protein [Actinoplanes sp. NPDC026670]|uniref:hypothetical protein n=1 Tax=Actinoplanes sp. NPDC026670 TaxID=3154700 RepID=UPI0034060F3A